MKKITETITCDRCGKKLKKRGILVNGFIYGMFVLPYNAIMPAKEFCRDCKKDFDRFMSRGV